MTWSDAARSRRRQAQGRWARDLDRVGRVGRRAGFGRVGDAGHDPARGVGRAPGVAVRGARREGLLLRRVLCGRVQHLKAVVDDPGAKSRRVEQVHAETAAQFIDGDVAMWMGWVSFINKENELVKVDKSFGYKQTPEGALKIVLHHSSLPFEG